MNLSESVHASWLFGEGGKKKISLYDACVTDVLNSYIQCAKRLGYMTGRFIGSGPSIESMLARTSNNQTPSPANVAQVVHGAVAQTPMFEEPKLHRDKETSKGRGKILVELKISVHIDQNFSWSQGSIKLGVVLDTFFRMKKKLSGKSKMKKR